MGTLKNTKLFFKSSMELPCSYIKGNIERRVNVSISYPHRESKIVSDLTKNGFRRNYNHMYMPVCNNCNSCISSRINIKKFVFSKNYRRNLKNNSDLILIKNKYQNKERFNLFKKYCQIRHSDGQMKDMSWNGFLDFFHNSTNQTEVYDLIDKDNKLYASILLDVLEDGFSAVYSFFDPFLKRRGLGKNIILNVIQRLKKENKSFLYLGYWVKESSRMNYKSSFNNIELFFDGNWIKKES
jgi:arginine-tRNA-protein transferase